MQVSFDIVIIGGGPAGSSVALTLKKRHPDLSLALIEASHYEKWRVGETLSPEAGRAFRTLGIWDSFLAQSHSPALGTSAAWENEWIHENEFIFHPEGKGWHLDRVKFDYWMAKEAEKKGVTLFTDTQYTGHRRTENEEFSLRFKKANTTFNLNAKFVVDASGRSSGFMKKEGGKRTVIDRLSGAVGIFNAQTLMNDSKKAYTLVEASKNGWWYSSALPCNKVVIAYMTDADILKQESLHDSSHFKQALKETVNTKKRTPEHSELEQLKILSAASLTHENVCGKNWIAIGDSASTFDPLSSQGIYKSIRSGLFGGYAISDLLNGVDKSFEKYEHYVREEYREYLDKRNEFYSGVKRWPESEFWNRRQEVLDLAF